jgi:hypothetical protein
MFKTSFWPGTKWRGTEAMHEMLAYFRALPGMEEKLSHDKATGESELFV